MNRIYFKNGNDENADEETEESNDSKTKTTDDQQELSTSDRLKRNEMEKTANWWSKYYASKAKLVHYCF